MLLTLILRATLRLALLCTLLCVLISALGGRPNPANALWVRAGFAACDLPCFANITPGKTAFLQAAPMLRRNVETMDRLYNSGSVIDFWAEDQRLAGSVNSENGVVTEVRMNLPISLNPFLAVLQAPDCVIVGTPDSPLLRLVVVWVRTGDVDWGSVGCRDADRSGSNAGARALDSPRRARRVREARLHCVARFRAAVGVSPLVLPVPLSAVFPRPLRRVRAFRARARS